MQGTIALWPEANFPTLIGLNPSTSFEGSIDISPVILILGLMFFRNLVFEMFAPGLFLR